jgi:hypothetical protein
MIVFIYSDPTERDEFGYADEWADHGDRESFIVASLVDAFADLMAADPDARTSNTTVTGPRCRSARCRPTPTRCWGTPTSTGSASLVSEISPYEAGLDWSELTDPTKSPRSWNNSVNRRPRCTASTTPTATSR